MLFFLRTTIVFYYIQVAFLTIRLTGARDYLYPTPAHVVILIGKFIFARYKLFF